MNSVTDRVARGAALLDEKRPDWFMSVNPHVLDMSACDACVLGQLYGDFNEALFKHGVVQPRLAAEYGFDQDEPASRNEWPHLRAEWVSVINDRRARRYLKGESK